MAVKRNGLGKGLDSLIPNKSSKPSPEKENQILRKKKKVH